MRCGLISIGTELVTGQCLDTNAPWLSVRLAAVGVEVVEHVTVADDVDRIAGALRAALRDVDLVIATGGLGPTADDLTRQALAHAINKPLEENEDALRDLRAFFERWQRPMSEANRVQALVPRGCGLIHNRRGTAPGLRFQSDRAELFVMPGVPAEMEAMFEESVLPVIQQAGGGACILTGTLLCFGIAEAKLGSALTDLMERGRNPSVGTTAKEAVIAVRVVARGPSTSEAERLVEADLQEVRRRLGPLVFGTGEDTLQDAVARLLSQQGKTVATAESCTGGLLAKRLTDVPGSSGYFLQGFVTYSNQAKTDRLGVPAEMIERKGAVSEEVARAMATGCRETTGADFALSLTGIAGPEGGTPGKPVGLVYIGLAGADGVDVKRFLFGEHLARTEIRDRSAKTALNLLRRELIQ